MRMRYCTTISREVMRPCCMAVCISRMFDSTTVNCCLLAGVGLWAARRRAIVAKTRECVIAILPLDKMERKRITLLGGRLLAERFAQRRKDPPRRKGAFAQVVTTSTLDDVGPPFVPLRRRSFFDASGDGPDVPRRIDNPPGAIAPQLVLHRNQDLRPRNHRALNHGVHVFDIDEDNHRRAPVWLWSAARKRWPLCFYDHHLSADRQQRMHYRPIRTRSSPKLHGAKRSLAKVNLSRNVMAHQHRYHN